MKPKFTLGLFLILVLFFFKGIFLILIIPPWEAPDEPGHVAYVHYLYNYKKIPSSTKPFILSSISESLIKNRKILESIRNDKLKIKNNGIDLFDRNETGLDPPILANLASHPPLYYIYLLPFYMSSLFLSSYWTLILLRLGSLFLGIYSLILVFFISKQLYPVSKKIPYIIIFLVSLQPMFSFISSIVNKDIMAVFAFLTFIFFALNILRSQKIQRYSLVYLFLITTLSPLIVPQLFILIPLYFLILYFKRQKNNLMYYLPSFLVVVPSALWFLYKFMTDGIRYLSYSVQNTKHSITPFWKYPIEFVSGKQPIGIFMSFWGFFGWLDVPMPKWTYILFLISILLALYGYYLNRKKVFLISSKNKKVAIFLIAAFIIYSLSIFLFDLQVFVLSHAFVIHGRYLAPILPLLIIFLVQGMYVYATKIKRVLIFLVILIFVLNQFVAIFSINNAYYESFILPKVLPLKIYNF